MSFWRLAPQGISGGDDLDVTMTGRQPAAPPAVSFKENHGEDPISERWPAADAQCFWEIFVTLKPAEPSRRDLLAAAAGLSMLASSSPAASQLPVTPPSLAAGQKMRLGMVLFNDFEVLDVYGPLSMFGALKDRVEILTIAERTGIVTTGTGLSVIADVAFGEAPSLDLLIIPGGLGTRREVNNSAFLRAIRHLAEATPRVATVCTGSAVLAKTGLLDGKRATSNKMAWAWATAQGSNVLWVPKARWVEDGKFISSSGVSAGIDMALSMIAKLYGKETAMWAANRAEYRWHDDPAEDPFAELNGL